LQSKAGQLKHLPPFSSAHSDLRQILLTVLALSRGKQDPLISLLDHPQGVASMAGLASTLFATLFSQARRFAHRLLEPVAGGGLTTIVAVFAGLSFQLLDASLGLFQTLPGLCQGRLQRLLVGELFFQLLDASSGLFKPLQGSGQLVAPGLIFGSLPFQFLYQFEAIHEATRPNGFLPLNLLGLFSSPASKEA
jgi:hypothetical protein